MDILSFGLGELGTNCYFVFERKSKKGIVIDPAEAGEFLVEKIVENGLEITKIIATHGHFDHVLAATYLQLTLDVPFYIHQKDEFLLKRMRKTARHFLGRDPGPEPKVSGHFHQGDEIEVGEISLKVVHTPGHTPGSVSLVSQDEVFVGDLLFSQGAVGRTDFSYSSHKDLKDSIKKILSLPDSTVIYPGHGDPTTVKEEKELRNFE